MAIECLSTWKCRFERGDADLLAVMFHQGIELPAGDRGAPPREEQARCGALALAQVSLQGRDLVRAEGVDPRQGALDAADGQALLREIQVLHL